MNNEQDDKHGGETMKHPKDIVVQIAHILSCRYRERKEYYNH